MSGMLLVSVVVVLVVVGGEGKWSSDDFNSSEARLILVVPIVPARSFLSSSFVLPYRLTPRDFVKFDSSLESSSKNERLRDGMAGSSIGLESCRSLLLL